MTASPAKRRLVIVQYSGDYRDAFHRIKSGSGETYYAHKYVLESLQRLCADAVDEIVVLHAFSGSKYDEYLTPCLRVVSTGFNIERDRKNLLGVLGSLQPTYLALLYPSKDVFKWAIKHRIKTLGILADSFSADTLRGKIRDLRLGRTLNHPTIEWVANHGINACKSLESIGVKAHKILPWDWPHPRSPADFSPKTLRQGEQPWRLAYVGGVHEVKGVLNILEAMAILRQKSIATEVKIAGRGDLERFKAMAADLGVGDCVQFLGSIANGQIVDPLMREADCVVVPSHHQYPEGLPLTIYEALTARTPLIASDHPMFMGNLEHEVSALIFPADSSQALADRIQQLMNSPELYRQLSQRSEAAWQRLQIPLKWADLIGYWLERSPESKQALQGHSIKTRTQPPANRPLALAE